jgi:hypothetical protein
LASSGVFIRLNRSAEELEPEAMEQAKREDAKASAAISDGLTLVGFNVYR